MGTGKWKLSGMLEPVKLGSGQSSDVEDTEYRWVVLYRCRGRLCSVLLVLLDFRLVTLSGTHRQDNIIYLSYFQRVRDSESIRESGESSHEDDMEYGGSTDEGSADAGTE